LPTPDDEGDWLSDEADPQAIVSDGKWVFLGAAGCELGWRCDRLRRAAARGTFRRFVSIESMLWPDPSDAYRSGRQVDGIHGGGSA
jgi:hypothetical protein